MDIQKGKKKLWLLICVQGFKKKENEKEGIWLTHLNYCYKLFKIKPFYFGF